MRETPIVYFKTNKKCKLWGIIAKPNNIFISITVEITFFRQDLPMENLTDHAVLISKITWIRRSQTLVVKSFACDCFFKLLRWFLHKDTNVQRVLKHHRQQGTQAREASAPGGQNVLSNLLRERERDKSPHGIHQAVTFTFSFRDTFTKWRCFLPLPWSSHNKPKARVS